MSQLEHTYTRLRPHLPALVPGVAAVALLLVWAAHDGGYDPATWYWGALVSLSLVASVLIGVRQARRRLSTASLVALCLFSLYVAWSYLSITWAASPGDALQGSNRALLYLLLFALMTVLPWTPRAALFALVLFTLGVGLIAVVLLFRMASGDHIGDLLVGGRLASPTGYFNATAALFTVQSLTAIALSVRRELPGIVRGLLIAVACAGLQLAVAVQSRGWLFTLPFVAIASIAVVSDRLRVATAALIPLVATVVPLHLLLDVYNSPAPEVPHAAIRAAQASLLICAGALVLGTLVAWAESSVSIPEIGSARRRILGTAAAALAIVAVGVAGTVATHGHPFAFVKRQWDGFSHPQMSSSGSHFGDVGSGRYDFWRVALDALRAHPVGGLGQDNFADYYVSRRRTSEEPAWTHSLEMRLLAHTGLVGFLLFVGFIVAALAAALRVRRRGDPLSAAVAGVAVLPLIDWLIHGSVDWFWEIPALAGPALGFVGMAAALRIPHLEVAVERSADRPVLRVAAMIGGVAALVGAITVLGFAYLSVAEVSVAGAIRDRNPAQALHRLKVAANLNPLSADPGRIAGTIALQEGDYTEAVRRFGQAISRERGGWYAWLGQGLAASALGDTARAKHDFEVAAAINSRQPAVSEALARVNTIHPLTVAEAFRALVVVG